MKSAKFIPEELELATGLEKVLIEEAMKGNTDPFQMEVQPRGPGTVDCPNIVWSAFPTRIFGCICNEDDMHINYMWITEECPVRCECGCWFKLQRYKPVWPKSKTDC